MLETKIITPQLNWGSSTEPNRLQSILKYTPTAGTVLDFGCGKGAYIEALNLLDYTCRGVDLFAFKEWSAIAKRLNQPKAELFQTLSGDTLPFGDKEFDTSIAFEVLEHCPYPKAILEELKRVTKKTICLSVPNCTPNPALQNYSLALNHWTDQTHVNFFIPKTFQKLVTDCGLRVVESLPAYEIHLNNAYWSQVKLPPIIRKSMKRVMRPFSPSYYSSILLIVAIDP